jgi:hypothetical protein
MTMRDIARTLEEGACHGDPYPCTAGPSAPATKTVGLAAVDRGRRLDDLAATAERCRRRRNAHARRVGRVSRGHRVDDEERANGDQRDDEAHHELLPVPSAEGMSRHRGTRACGWAANPGDLRYHVPTPPFLVIRPADSPLAYSATTTCLLQQDGRGTRSLPRGRRGWPRSPPTCPPFGIPLSATGDAHRRE